MNDKGTDQTASLGMLICTFDVDMSVRFSHDEAHLSVSSKLKTCIISNIKYNVKQVKKKEKKKEYTEHYLWSYFSLKF